MNLHVWIQVKVHGESGGEARVGFEGDRSAATRSVERDKANIRTDVEEHVVGSQGREHCARVLRLVAVANDPLPLDHIGNLEPYALGIEIRQGEDFGQTGSA